MSKYGSPTVTILEPIYSWRKSQKDIFQNYPIHLSTDDFLNSYGFYRWHIIRSAYWDGVIDEGFVTDLYCKWRDTSEYFMLDGYDATGDKQLSAFVKASKRGNDVYKALLKKKFKFFDELPPVEFFNDADENKCTSVLFVTLTVDPKKYDLKLAWSIIADELNRFETLLRQKFGTFAKFRVWESHESGYPHSHIVYSFTSKKGIFKVWDHYDKDNNLSWRLIDKDRDAIKHMWSMGNIDVQGVQDTLGALSEVQKYVTKTIWSTKADKTNAMLTLFHKQSYWISTFNPLEQPIPESIQQIKQPFKRMAAVSRYLTTNLKKWAKKDLIGSIWGSQIYLQFYKKLGNETLAEPGCSALVKRLMCNYNIDFPEIVEWRLVGFILGSDIYSFYPKNKNLWSFGVKDPPPELYACINFPDVYER